MDNRNDIVKWANSCRLCLLDDGIKLPIFEGEGIQRQVARKILTCFPIVIYVADPLPKMICHKCLYKLDTVYNFRHKCLEANAVLKKQLLTMTHMAEVKEYLDALESVSSLRKVTQKPLPPVIRQVKTSQNVVPGSKGPLKEDETGSPQFGNNSENVFQEVFLTDCSNDIFFPEQSSDDTVQVNENGTNLSKSPSRDQTVFTAPANSVRFIAANPDDIAATSHATMTKQEPEDEILKENSLEGSVTSQPSSPLSQPRNDTLPNTDLEPVSVDLEKVKEEAVTECSKCKIIFQDKGQLQEHMCTVVSQWSCEHCNKCYKSKHTLYKHKKYFCPKKKNSCVCKGCSKVFSSVIEMAKHQKQHLRVCLSLQEESLYTCTVCEKKFAARSMLEMHKNSHFPGNLNMKQTERFSVQPNVSPGKVLIKQFKCRHCPKSYTRKYKLKYHMKTHFSEAHNSSVPELSMETKQENNNDKDNDAVSQCLMKCSCKYCGYVCDDSAALWLHMLQQHSSVKSYKCDKCGRDFHRLQAYSNHMKTHNVKMSCRVCGKHYSSIKALREHGYNKHTIQKAMHQCRLCAQSFATRSALLIHGRDHHAKGKSSAPLSEDSQAKVETFPCSLCSKSFPSTVSLVAHMQMHVGMEMGNGNMDNLDQGPVPQSSCKKEEQHYPFTCKICFKLFSSKGGLQRHIKIHDPKKHVFYPCKICGKKFVSESTYKTHTATHVVSVPFHCPQCNQIFFKEEVFKSHVCENTGNQASLTCGVLLTEEKHLNHVCDGSNLKSSELLVKCNICSAVFSSLKSRNNHMRIHLKRSMPLTALQSNVNNLCSRMSSGLYKCNLCSKRMVTQHAAAGHAKWHYQPQPVKAFECPFCNRRYTTETGLYTHISVEHPDVPG